MAVTVEDEGAGGIVPLAFSVGYDPPTAPQLAQHLRKLLTTCSSRRHLLVQEDTKFFVLGDIKISLHAFSFVDIVVDCNVEDERAGGVVLLQDSVGYGAGRLNYNASSRLLVWDIRTQNLAGDLMQLHFHGPAPLDDTGELQV